MARGSWAWVGSRSHRNALFFNFDLNHTDCLRSEVKFLLIVLWQHCVKRCDSRLARDGGRSVNCVVLKILKCFQSLNLSFSYLPPFRVEITLFPCKQTESNHVTHSIKNNSFPRDSKEEDNTYTVFSITCS